MLLPYFRNDQSLSVRLLSIVRLTPWSFRAASWLVLPRHLCLTCTEVNAVIISPESSIFHVCQLYQSMQLSPTWDGQKWVKRFGPGDPPSPAALLMSVQVSLPTTNFQSICYFLPTRLCKWLLRLFFETPSIGFLISLLDMSRYLKQLLRVWLVNPVNPTSTGKYFISQLASWRSWWGQHTCTFSCCWLVQSFLLQGQSISGIIYLICSGIDGAIWAFHSYHYHR